MVPEEIPVKPETMRSTGFNAHKWDFMQTSPEIQS